MPDKTQSSPAAANPTRRVWHTLTFWVGYYRTGNNK